MTLFASEVQHNPVRKRRAKRKVLPRSPFDHRTRQGKRALELAAAFRARLNADPVDTVLGAAIEKAARLIALSEDASAKALNGDPRITLDDVVRLARLSDLAVKRLHLDRKPQHTGPDLHAYLRELKAKEGA
jgi:hypothetical protein